MNRRSDPLTERLTRRLTGRLVDPESATGEYLEKAVADAGVVTIPRILYDALMAVTVQHSHVRDVTVATLLDHTQEVDDDTLRMYCRCGHRYDPRTDSEIAHATHVADYLTDQLHISTDTSPSSPASTSASSYDDAV